MRAPINNYNTRTIYEYVSGKDLNYTFPWSVITRETNDIR